MNLIQQYIEKNQLTNTIRGKVFKTFAESIEIIPKILILNSLPQYNEMILHDVLRNLHSRNQQEDKCVGVNGQTENLIEMDMCDSNVVIESIMLKQNIIQAAVDITCAIMKIDSNITQPQL
jgi:chaperonin GroEL (HSP60 family)